MKNDFDYGQTELQTLVNVESLLPLKIQLNNFVRTQDKSGSFSHFFYFSFFHVLKHANLQRKDFLVYAGESTPLPESHNFGPNWGKTLKFL